MKVDDCVPTETRHRYRFNFGLLDSGGVDLGSNCQGIISTSPVYNNHASIQSLDSYLTRLILETWPGEKTRLGAVTQEQ